MTDTKTGLKNLIECACKPNWPTRFGHSLLLAESLVDPARFHGTVYRADLPPLTGPVEMLVH